MSTAIPSKLADTIELWEIGQLVAYSNNPREHSPDQVRRIASSISEFGFLSPILVDRESREIIAGHGRLEAARLLGLQRVPVVPLEHLSSAQRRAYLIADNRLGELSTWNDERLRDELGKLSVELHDLPELGFDAGKLRRLLAPQRPSPPEIDAERASGKIVRPITRPGDVWLLGDQRLVCGDCRLEETRKLALGGDLVDCVVTDPPYAIFGSSTGVGADVADDRMVRDFFATVLRSIAATLKVNGHAYVFCDWRSYPAWFECSRGGMGLVVANLIVWSKRVGLGTNWQNTHELVTFFHRSDPKRSVWSKGARGVRAVAKPNVLSFNRAGAGGFEAGESSTEDTVTEHNAAKPVDLLRELVCASTDPGERVLDLFGGSASTLIACELTRRRGVAIEVEPRWCDVSIGRLQRMTEKTATLEGDGRTFAEVGAAREIESNARPKRARRSKSAKG